MYISTEGTSLLSSQAIVKDKLDAYFKLDVKDIPFRHIGIAYNFSKSNLYEAIAYLRLVCSRAIQHINDQRLSLSDIRYNNGNFNIIFNYDGKDLIYEVEN